MEVIVSYYPKSYFEDIVRDWFKLLGLSYLRNVKKGKYEIDFIITHPTVAVVEATSWEVVLTLENGGIKAYGYDPLENKVYRKYEVYYSKFCNEKRKAAIKAALKMYKLNPERYDEWLIVWSIYKDNAGLKPRIESLGIGGSSKVKTIYYASSLKPNLKIMTLNTMFYHILCYYKHGGVYRRKYTWIQPIAPTQCLPDAIVYQLITFNKEDLLNKLLLTLRELDNIKYKNELPTIRKPCKDLLT
ncbi:MAG: hypothetical protein DRN04_19865 [Thermoprotei archaeon]|nr:MAG: hypothetical protein DRN04_19865 [Thermoprotei archaeon]